MDRHLGVDRGGSSSNLHNSTTTLAGPPPGGPIIIASSGGNATPRILTGTMTTTGTGGRSTPPPNGNGGGTAAAMLALAGGSPSSNGVLTRLNGQDSLNRTVASSHPSTQYRPGTANSTSSMPLLTIHGGMNTGGLSSPPVGGTLTAPLFGGGHKNSRRPSVNDWKPFHTDNQRNVQLLSPGTATDNLTQVSSTPRTINNIPHRHGERGGIGGVGALSGPTSMIGAPGSHAPANGVAAADGISPLPGASSAAAGVGGTTGPRFGNTFDTFSRLGRPSSSSTEVKRKKIQQERMQ
jgi:hypothetical protein